MSEFLHKLAGELRVSEQRLEDHHQRSEYEGSEADEFKRLYERFKALHGEIETAINQAPADPIDKMAELRRSVDALGAAVGNLIEKSE